MKPVNYSNKWIRVVTHVLLWGIVFSLPYILYKSTDRPPRTLTEAEKTSVLYVNLFSNIFWVGMFYLNAYILVPRLIYTRKLLLYAILIVVLYCIIVVLHTSLLRMTVPGIPFSFFRGARFNMGPYLLSLATSTAWQMWSDRAR